MVLRFFTLSILLFGFFGCETSTTMTIGGDIMLSSRQDGPTAYGYKNYFEPTLQEISNFGISGTAVDITLSKDGKIAYIASGSNGLEIIDVSDPEYPFLIESYDLDAYINRVELVNDLVYAAYIPQSAADYYNISLIDAQNPYNPHYLGTIEGTLNQPHTSLTEGDYLFTVTQEGIAIYDLRAGIGEDTMVSEYTAGDSVYAFALYGDYLYLANGRWGLTILKII